MSVLESERRVVGNSLDTQHAKTTMRNWPTRACTYLMYLMYMCTSRWALSFPPLLSRRERRRLSCKIFKRENAPHGRCIYRRQREREREKEGEQRYRRTSSRCFNVAATHGGEALVSLCSRVNNLLSYYKCKIPAIRNKRGRERERRR